MKECPHCRLVNTDTAERCDCGYDFGAGSIEGKPSTSPAEMPRYPGIFQAIGLTLLLVLAQVLFAALAGGFSPNAHLMSPRFAICDLLAFAVIFAYGLRKTKASFSEVFPLTSIDPFLYFGIALCLIGLYAIMFNVDSLIYAAYPPPAFVRHIVPDLLRAGGYWNAFFQLVVVAPVTEEFMFRGLILRGFLKRYNTVTAVVASALLFGMVHGNIYQFSLAVVLGLFLGWWALETRSLLPCLFGHAFFNFFAIVVFTVPHQWPSSYVAKGLQHLQFVPAWFILLGACLLGAGMFSLHRSFPTSQTATAELTT